MENNLIKVDPAQFGLEEAKANELTIGLKTILEERKILTDAYNDTIKLEITEENIDTFRSLRINIRDNRTKGIEKWHKTNKEYFLTGGRFVDAIKNKEIAENERMEEMLLKAEKHFENIEKERVTKLHNERVEKLAPFGYEIGQINFGEMDENMFIAILTGAEKQYTDKIAAEKKLEEERQEAIRLEEEKQRKQLEELEALRIANEAKEKALQEQKAKAEEELRLANEKAAAEKLEAERLAKEEADKQAKILAEQKAKADAQLAEQKRIADEEAKKKEAELKKAKEEADKLAKQLADKKAAEAKIEADRIAEEKKAAKAPDQDKLKSALNSILFPVLDMKTADGHRLYIQIQDQFSKLQKWANGEIEKM
jgi:hypothetical protein